MMQSIFLIMHTFARIFMNNIICFVSSNNCINHIRPFQLSFALDFVVCLIASELGLNYYTRSTPTQHNEMMSNLILM